MGSPKREREDKHKVQAVKTNGAKAKPEATTKEAESNWKDTPSPSPEESTTSPKTLATDRAAEASSNKVLAACGVFEPDLEE